MKKLTPQPPRSRAFFGNVGVHFLDERGPDMLILEAPSIGGTGSPAGRMVEQIVNESPCPVVVVNSCTQPGVPLITQAEALEPFLGH